MTIQFNTRHPFIFPLMLTLVEQQYLVDLSCLNCSNASERGGGVEGRVPGTLSMEDFCACPFSLASG